MHTLFFWTPQLSADILWYLLEQKDVEIIWVVSNPDTTGGRGHEVISSPVSQLAREKNIPLFQPEKVNNEEFLSTIKELKPDIWIVIAYGKILPQALLDIPKYWIINVHTSLLPKYRWAAPIQSALLNGEKETGLTIMQMSLGMDEGDILLQEKWNIEPTDTTGSLFEKTGKRWGPLLIEALQKMQDETLERIPQDASRVTYSSMIKKQDGELQFSWTTEETLHRWQAYTPWPGLYTSFNWTKVTLLEVEEMKQWISDENEQWNVINKLPAIRLTDGYLIIRKILPAGKKPMTGEEFVRGYMKKGV